MIGVRGYEVERPILDREIITVETPFGSVRVKVASRDGEVVNSAPEFEDCRECAIRCGVPLKRVYQEALRLAAERW